MIDHLEILDLEHIPNRVHQMQDSGYRFVTITCCSNQDGTVDLFYTFDKDLELATLKTTFQADTTVESVSNIYLAAAFAENEIAELFGVHFTGLAINYGGRFILPKNSPDSPFGKGVILVNKDGGPYAG